MVGRQVEDSKGELRSTKKESRERRGEVEGSLALKHTISWKFMSGGSVRAKTYNFNYYIVAVKSRY